MPLSWRLLSWWWEQLFWFRRWNYCLVLDLGVEGIDLVLILASRVLPWSCSRRWGYWLDLHLDVESTDLVGNDLVLVSALRVLPWSWSWRWGYWLGLGLGVEAVLGLDLSVESTVLVFIFILVLKVLYFSCS